MNIMLTFFPLKSDEKAVPLINDQVLETQTLFEIEKVKLMYLQSIFLLRKYNYTIQKWSTENSICKTKIKRSHLSLMIFLVPTLWALNLVWYFFLS